MCVELCMIMDHNNSHSLPNNHVAGATRSSHWIVMREEHCIQSQYSHCCFLFFRMMDMDPYLAALTLLTGG